MSQVYIGLGANLGPAIHSLKAAAQQLGSHPCVSQLMLSPLYRSQPVDAQGPDYVNAVASLQTSLAPLPLLQLLQNIEQQHGRERPYRNAPRPLDLDLLLYGQLQLTTKELTVPHPRMHERAFVLQPLQDLNPTLVLEQGPLDTLLTQCSDQVIEKIT